MSTDRKSGQLTFPWDWAGPSLTTMRLSDLRRDAAKLGIKGASRMPKFRLLRVLSMRAKLAAAGGPAKADQASWSGDLAAAIRDAGFME